MLTPQIHVPLSYDGSLNPRSTGLAGSLNPRSTGLCWLLKSTFHWSMLTPQIHVPLGCVDFPKWDSLFNLLSVLMRSSWPDLTNLPLNCTDPWKLESNRLTMALHMAFEGLSMFISVQHSTWSPWKTHKYALNTFSRNGFQRIAFDKHLQYLADWLMLNLSHPFKVDRPKLLLLSALVDRWRGVLGLILSQKKHVCRWCGFLSSGLDEWFCSP